MNSIACSPSSHLEHVLPGIVCACDGAAPGAVARPEGGDCCFFTGSASVFTIFHVATLLCSILLVALLIEQVVVPIGKRRREHFPLVMLHVGAKYVDYSSSFTFFMYHLWQVVSRLGGYSTMSTAALSNHQWSSLIQWLDRETIVFSARNAVRLSAGEQRDRAERASGVLGPEAAVPGRLSPCHGRRLPPAAVALLRTPRGGLP